MVSDFLARALETSGRKRVFQCTNNGDIFLPFKVGRLAHFLMVLTALSSQLLQNGDNQQNQGQCAFNEYQSA
jgi:hypothetical protein